MILPANKNMLNYLFLLSMLNYRDNHLNRNPNPKNSLWYFCDVFHLQKVWMHDASYSHNGTSYSSRAFTRCRLTPCRYIEDRTQEKHNEHEHHTDAKQGGQHYQERNFQAQVGYLLCQARNPCHSCATHILSMMCFYSWDLSWFLKRRFPTVCS